MQAIVTVTSWLMPLRLSLDEFINFIALSFLLEQVYAT